MHVAHLGALSAMTSVISCAIEADGVVTQVGIDARRADGFDRQKYNPWDRREWLELLVIVLDLGDPTVLQLVLPDNACFTVASSVRVTSLVNTS